MSGGIESIFNPSAIAVVGATKRPGSVGLAVLNNLLHGGSQGIIYPANPKARSVQGVKAYPTIADVPDDTDLAAIVVPAEQVATIVEECARKKVKGVIVITAGFKDVGGRGIQLERELKEVAGTHGIRLVGPNCLGVINTHPRVQMNASFARIMPRPGRIGFISQSGALCTAVVDYAAGRNIGFSKFISFGNKADVDEIDLLRYLKDDPETDVILMYVEDISNGREFLETARQITWDGGSRPSWSSRAAPQRAPRRRPLTPAPLPAPTPPMTRSSSRVAPSGWRPSISFSTPPSPSPGSRCRRGIGSPSSPTPAAPGSSPPTPLFATASPSPPSGSRPKSG